MTETGNSTLTALIMLYSLSGFFSLGAFMPQIIKLWKDKTRRERISIPAWSMWFANACVVTSYAWLINKDPLFCLTATLSFVGSFLSLALVVYNRHIRPVLQEVTLDAGESVKQTARSS